MLRRHAHLWPFLSALIGAIGWLVVGAPRVGQPTHTVLQLILLAPMVTVPLGVALVDTPRRDGKRTFWWWAAAFAQFPAMLAVVASGELERGAVAGALTLPWLVVTLALFAFGLWRLLQRGLGPAEELAIDAGLVFVPVGACWLTASRFGWHPLGFGDVITELTAAHFHFAGFALPIITANVGRLGRARGLPGFGAPYAVAVTSVVVTIPLLALGIAWSPVLEWTAAWWLVGATVLAAVLQFITLRAATLASAPALALSSASVIVAMLAAATYALGELLGKHWLLIPEMARMHGTLNAVGFSLLGMVGWALLRPPARCSAPGVPFSKLRARGGVGADYFERIGARVERSPAPTGLIDDLGAYRSAELDTEHVAPALRAFYEHTDAHELVVVPEWSNAFLGAARLWTRIARSVGQMELPLEPETGADTVESRIFAVDDGVDGRHAVRAWVRTYAGSTRPMYVAAYSTHVNRNTRFMNIAFAFVGGNISSILRMDPARRGRGISLTTLPHPTAPPGDEGVYYATPLLPLRLPFNETIEVWDASEPASTDADELADAQRPWTAFARHDMWLFGAQFLVLHYLIRRAPSA